MDNASYIAIGRQIQLFRTMDTVANNVANVDTPGFKQESMMFSEYLSDAGRHPSGSGVHHKISYSQDIATIRNLAAGEFGQTGRPLDVAIDGQGYFAVDDNGQTLYTRVGSFAINQTGQIINDAGNLVHGVGGAPIIFESTDQEIKIDETGLITVRNPSGDQERRGQIEVTLFDNERELRRIDGTRFVAPEIAGGHPAQTSEYRIAQGVIEKSNVNPTIEITRMITVSRSATSAAKVVNDLHELQRDMVSRVGRPAQ